MRVAILVTRFPVRSETFVVAQITGLLRRGVDVEIIAGTPNEPLPNGGPVIEHTLLARTRWVRLPTAVRGELLDAGLRALRNVLQRPALVLRSANVRRYGFAAGSGRLLRMATALPRGLRYDVIHAHFGPNGLLATGLLELGVLAGKLSTAFHGIDMIDVHRHFGAHQYGALFARAELLLPVSEQLRQRLIAQGAPAARTHVHRMGVDLTRFVRAAREHGGPVRLLSVGRLYEKKGFHDAIAAIARLPRSAPLVYRIIGTGPCERSLRQAIDRCGLGERVQLTGAATHDEVQRAMSEADVFVAPSIVARDGDEEGLPVAIMEAMAMQLPVLATAHTAIPELVADGVAGYLVPERSPEALADRLAQLIANAELRRAMGMAGRAIVARDYDIERLNDRLLERFRALAGRESDSHEGGEAGRQN